MSDPDPAFDAIHPSGQLMFRSSRGGCLHSVVLSDVAMTADAPSFFQLPDGPCGVDTAHDGHRHVHEDDGVVGP